jgi:hypothetical protein
MEYHAPCEHSPLGYFIHVHNGIIYQKEAYMVDGGVKEAKKRIAEMLVGELP